MPKKCTKCGIEKNEAAFGKSGARLRAYCKACAVVAAKAWAAANKERKAASLAEWRAKNAEHVARYSKARRAVKKEDDAATTARWRAANKERVAATHAAYVAAHRERITDTTRAWRAAHPDWYTQYPERKRANKALRTAVMAGRVEPLPCWECGSDKVVAHHPAYSLPLAVVWLCRKHHRQVHEEAKWLV